MMSNKKGEKKMKKVLVGAVASGLIVSNSMAFDFGSILSPITSCYQIKDFSVDVCSLLPNVASIGVDNCSNLPDIIGFNKKTSNLNINSNAYAKNYCNKAVKKVNTVISDIDIYAGDIINNGKYPDGRTPTDFYKGIVKNILKDSSIVKKAFTDGNNRLTREIIRTGQINGTQELTTIKQPDLQAPKNYDDYLQQVDFLSKTMIFDTVASTPLNVSTELSTKLDGKQGATAKGIAESYTQNVGKYIESYTDKRIGFEIDLNRKDEDLAIPIQEAVEMYRADIQPEKVALVKDQIRREAKIKSQVLLKDKLRADTVSLVAQKTLIMNEKFDRQQARDEIEALLQ